MAQTMTPDSPFRQGSSGKYKLLIKEVELKHDHVEYKLVDADGNEYSADSKSLYEEGQILRCIVAFTVKNARLVVTETSVCNKQDLAPLIRTLKVEHPKQVIAKKDESVYAHLGDPTSTGKSGDYILRVIEVKLDNNNYAYVLEDAKRRKYYANSKKRYSVGDNINCQVKVTKQIDKLLFFDVTIKSAHKTKKTKKIKQKAAPNPLSSSKRKKRYDKAAAARAASIISPRPGPKYVNPNADRIKSESITTHKSIHTLRG